MSRLALPGRTSLRTYALLLLPLSLFAGACATVGSFGHPDRFDDRPALVTIRSDHWEDLTIYLDREGTQFRLGVVPGNATRTLKVPAVYLSRGTVMCFVAKQAGREVHTRSALFALTPGARARWILSLAHLESPVIVTDGGS